MALRSGLGRAARRDLKPTCAHSHLTARTPKYVEVSAGICLRDDGSYLLAQRPEGKPYAGYWEFPGGKVEPCETPAQALVRELEEELGVEPLEYYPWITRTHHYEHANVRLRFFRITRWHGEFVCKEFQSIHWHRPGFPEVAPMLPANGPILRALGLPVVLGISQATELCSEAFQGRLEQALAGGLRFVMLREKSWPSSMLLEYAAQVLIACRRSRALCVVNADPDIAKASGADGVHLTSARLMDCTVRPDLPWCGASCHNASELEKAAALGLDYVVLGPVMRTLSHPGQSGLGWDAFADLVRDYPLPVYALGGLSNAELPQAWKHGAHGIAMMRGAWR